MRQAGKVSPAGDRTARRPIPSWSRDLPLGSGASRARDRSSPPSAPRGTPVSLLGPYPAADHEGATPKPRFRADSPPGRKDASGSRGVAAGPLVEAALRLLEAVAQDRLDRVGRPRHDRVVILVRLEGREDEIGYATRIAALGTSHSNPQAEEVRATEHLGNRAKPVVPREPASRASLQPTEIQVDLVVDHEYALGRDLEEARSRRDRAPRLVHERLRLQERDAMSVEPRLAEPAAEFRLERRSSTARELVDDSPPDVVPIALVSRARIAQPDDQ